MRHLLLASTVLLVPTLAHASPQCAIQPGAWTAEPPAASASASMATAAGSGAVQLRTDAAQAAPPAALKRILAAGAQITHLGSAHGLRRVVARNGAEFQLFQVTPDGDAVVMGVVSELTPDELGDAAAGQVKELGAAHGLRTLFATTGRGFQVAYVTPDGERVLFGVMWDATGHNVTRDQTKGIEGTVATVEFGPNAAGVRVDAGPASPAAQLAVVEKATAGSYGDPSKPKLYMFVDPMCSFSVRAMQELEPLVAKDKLLQLAVVPLSILDYKDGGRSTTSALAMLSVPPDQMVPAWAGGHLDGPPAPDAAAKLAGNLATSEFVGLRGTPTLFWRKADGSVGRADGLPADLDALVASMAR